ncbi:SigE family RNA polymerase sigma factor [Nocardioides daejeonensis]|uniref:SigE family RNA polymerase sigma factor n=1 Tax=Nocardioides daejeonensis TaxID=1046556 RepID=UPI000D74260C|nr:SigE family RNA polymerase sigma factor [Nocardioides daejeonensis]
MNQAERDRTFTEFVAARRTHLRRIAYALCGDWALAEDLVQTALEKAYVAWPRVRRRGAEEAFVRRILVRARIDETRRPWRRELAHADLPEAPAVDESDVADRSDLFRSLQELPVMQRRVVVLRHWLDLSVEQTAAELGISEGTVKSHSSRAVASLRRALTDLHC